MVRKDLNPTEVWHLSAEALHDEKYRNAYITALASVIKNKNLRILDTACGSGFPAIDLYEKGFHSIEASDADAQSVRELEVYFKDQNIPIPVSEGLWQELAQKVAKHFQVLVCADNSIVYMDGWADGTPEQGKEKVFERLSLVLKNFYDLLEDDGIAIVGLGKHYRLDVVAHKTPIRDLEKDGDIIHIDWNIDMDWEKRNAIWRTDIHGEKISGSTTQIAYLVTKEELADLMRKVGFKTVQIIEPEDTRDNLVVGTK